MENPDYLSHKTLPEGGMTRILPLIFTTPLKWRLAFWDIFHYHHSVGQIKSRRKYPGRAGAFFYAGKNMTRPFIFRGGATMFFVVSHAEPTNNEKHSHVWKTYTFPAPPLANPPEKKQRARVSFLGMNGCYIYARFNKMALTNGEHNGGPLPWRKMCICCSFCPRIFSTHPARFVSRRV